MGCCSVTRCRLVCMGLKGFVCFTLALPLSGFLPGATERGCYVCFSQITRGVLPSKKCSLSDDFVLPPQVG